MALPRGWCGLPEVPGVPDAGLEALRALLSSADGDAVAKEVVSTLRAAALEEGDADELDASSTRARFADDEVVDDILANSSRTSSPSACCAVGGRSPF